MKDSFLSFHEISQMFKMIYNNKGTKFKENSSMLGKFKLPFFVAKMFSIIQNKKNFFVAYKFNVPENKNNNFRIFSVAIHVVWNILNTLASKVVLQKQSLSALTYDWSVLL